MQQIRQTTLARIICDNAEGIEKVQFSAFMTADAFEYAFSFLRYTRKIDPMSPANFSSKFHKIYTQKGHGYILLIFTSGFQLKIYLS